MDVCFVFRDQPRGDAEREVVVLSSKTIIIHMTLRINTNLIRITIRVVFAKKSRVRSYQRLKNGKIEKVRSYYRRY